MNSKFSLICVISLFVILNSNAQNNSFFIGLSAGPQASFIINKNDYDAGGQLDIDRTIKFQLGLDLAYYFSRAISLQSGLILSRQGQHYLTNGNAAADFKTDLNYIKIPALINWNCNPASKFNFILQFGLQFALLQSAESNRARIGNALVPIGFYSNQTVDVKKFYANFILESVLSPAFNYRLSDRINIGAVLPFNISLSEIEKKSSKPDDRKPTSNATVALPQLYVHYNF